MTGERVKSKRGDAVIPVRSLEEMLSAIPASVNKKAYYVDEDVKGRHFFGIVGSSRMFYISAELYEMVGSPDVEEEIKISVILEKMGYAGQNSSSQKN